MKHHESIQGERVAIAWHSLWALLCLSDVAACSITAHIVMPLYSVGTPVVALLWTLGCQGMAAALGALWHVVAALEHRREVLRKPVTVHYYPWLDTTTGTVKGLPSDRRVIEAIHKNIRQGFANGGIVPNTKETKA